MHVYQGSGYCENGPLQICERFNRNKDRRQLQMPAPCTVRKPSLHLRRDAFHFQLHVLNLHCPTSMAMCNTDRLRGTLQANPISSKRAGTRHFSCQSFLDATSGEGYTFDTSYAVIKCASIILIRRDRRGTHDSLRCTPLADLLAGAMQVFPMENP